MILEKVYRSVEPEITVLELKGKLNAGNTLLSLENEVRKLVEQKPTKFVVDISGLEYLDSAGIGALLAFSSATAAGGGKMVLAGAKGRIRNLLSMTQVDRIMNLADSADAACQAF
jgi:anti-anti-sigma factor